MLCGNWYGTSPPNMAVADTTISWHGEIWGTGGNWSRFLRHSGKTARPGRHGQEKNGAGFAVSLARGKKLGHG
eukprot:gene14289-biopygen558